MLSNLLDNSRKNAPEEPVVVEAEVHPESAPPVVRVAVIDAGPGVDAESAERIFDKFVRVNDNAVNGTGLGLYIARGIVEAHGGRIWCESEPGARRTAFIFELPLAADTAMPETPNRHPAVPRPVRGGDPGARPARGPGAPRAGAAARAAEVPRPARGQRRAGAEALRAERTPGPELACARPGVGTGVLACLMQPHFLRLDRGRLSHAEGVSTISRSRCMRAHSTMLDPVNLPL